MYVCVGGEGGGVCENFPPLSARRDWLWVGHIFVVQRIDLEFCYKGNEMALCCPDAVSLLSHLTDLGHPDKRSRKLILYNVFQATSHILAMGATLT